MHKKIITLITIIALISSVAAFSYYYYQRKTKNITIFVHGTVLPGFAILNPYKAYNNSLNDKDWYVQSLRSIRKNPLMYEDCLMLSEGLHKIPGTILKQYKKQNLSKANSKKGAYQIVGAYNLINNAINNINTETSSNTKNTKYKFKDSFKNIFSKPQQKDVDHSQDYYTFGFSGILCQSYRQQAANELYLKLLELEDYYKQEYSNVNISLICYSHGGNVALLLPEIYKKNPDLRHLSIKDLVLLGTPIQVETAHYAKNIMFNKVLNIYSEGDAIQASDRISTETRTSFKQLEQFVDLNKYKHIYDARLLADNDPNIFGHLNYWCLNKYFKTNIFKYDDNIQEVIDTVSPLPIAVLIPVFIKSINNIDKLAPNKLDISLKAKQQSSFTINLLPRDKKNILYTSENIYLHLRKIQDYVFKSWYPYAISSECVKTGLGMWSALQALSNKIKNCLNFS